MSVVSGPSLPEREGKIRRHSGIGDLHLSPLRIPSHHHHADLDHTPSQRRPFDPSSLRPVEPASLRSFILSPHATLASLRPCVPCVPPRIVHAEMDLSFDDIKNLSNTSIRRRHHAIRVPRSSLLRPAAYLVEGKSVSAKTQRVDYDLRQVITVAGPRCWDWRLLPCLSLKVFGRSCTTLSVNVDEEACRKLTSIIPSRYLFRPIADAVTFPCT